MSAKYCWPGPFLEAAMRAGFAHRKGDDEWVFINDKMRDMLAEFAVAISEQATAAERERWRPTVLSRTPWGGLEPKPTDAQHPLLPMPTTHGGALWGGCAFYTAQQLLEYADAVRAAEREHIDKLLRWAFGPQFLGIAAVEKARGFDQRVQDVANTAGGADHAR